MFFDLPREQLEQYTPSRIEPRDFDEFWGHTLDEARQVPLNAAYEPVDAGLKLVETYDVTFNGYGGQPIKGWLLLPKQRSGDLLPCIVEYIGYGGGRGHVFDRLLWSTAGYAHFIMDTRGQGSAWSPGDTPDPEPEGSSPHYPGFMTRGILDPTTYYYRRVFTDAVRAIEAARSHDAVNPERIILTGGSQGGGITLAAAGLMSDVFAAMPDVPFLCHYRIATEITDAAPYSEISKYCKVHRDHVETVFTTLSYFDGLNFAVRAKCPALFSTGLMDDICPPRTVFAAYNHYAGSQKEIKVWPYNNHEGGEGYQASEKLRFVAGLL